MTIMHLVKALVITTALLNISACSTPKSKPVYPIGVYATEIMQAVNYATTLKKAGKLPGFKPDDHADVKLNAGYKSDDLSQPTFTFPIEVNITAVKDDEKESIYHYLFGKEDLDTPWKLVRAWKTTQNGAILNGDLLAAPMERDDN